MTTVIVIVFFVVYLGMILGSLPFLQLDRTGIALLGAIVLIGTEAVSPEAAARSVHLPTIILLFSFMVISAQLRLGGFYAWVTLKLTSLPLSPPALLGAIILVVALLSAIFSNDIICLAVAPVLIAACVGRKLNPIPYLLALACAANIGSAATLIGNPQNILIGSALRLPFAGYATQAAVPVILSLVATWALIALYSRKHRQAAAAPVASPDRREDDPPELNRWQSTKGLTVAAVLLIVFLFTDWPREVAALVGAGVLLTSRRMHSNKMLGLVDWELLVLFGGLFVVNHALDQTGLPAAVVADLAAAGFHLERPLPLFISTVFLSNAVSNVPAIMLLLPLAKHALAGPLLALVSTLAGNLMIVGSIANIIVVDAAARAGVRIDWRTHARVGVPVTLLTLALVAAWLAWGLS
jgi:Na+/H+ antiporter NhaD/arsenite permease-like protein